MKLLSKPILHCMLINAALIPNMQASTFTGNSVYANSGWNGTHGGPHNDDYSDIDLPRAFREKWSEFDNNAFEQAIAIGRDRSTLYAANGYGANTNQSNFVAVDQQGIRLWEIAPWTNTSNQYLPSATDPNRYNIGFDSCAAVNTAIVDKQGDIYISDCNQLWAFTKDGNVKWSTELPNVPDGSFCTETNKVPFQDTSAGKVNPLVVPIFTKDGSVGGVTMYGDFVLYDRATGEKSYKDYKIDASIGCTTVPMPKNTWKGIFDDELREWYYNWLNATDAFISADTPAVAVETTGWVFLSAKGSQGGNSLWSFDLTPPHGSHLGEITEAWQTPLDETGGSSPMSLS